MILGVILSFELFLSSAEAGAIVSPEVSPKAALKSLDKLLDELKILEEGRQEGLKNATGNPKYKTDPRMVEFLSALSLVDSLFVVYHKYYNAINTLIHSDEKSAAAHEALATIKTSRQQSIQLAKVIQTRAGNFKLDSPGLSADKNLNFLQTVFEATHLKNEEIEAQLRTDFYSSPFTKYMTDMPVMPDVSDIS
nr:PREDICTED: uncharacterized protein LOC109029892 isoform X1 [Bemisia tabaci]